MWDKEWYTGYLYVDCNFSIVQSNPVVYSILTVSSSLSSFPTVGKLLSYTHVIWCLEARHCIASYNICLRWCCPNPELTITLMPFYTATTLLSRPEIEGYHSILLGVEDLRQYTSTKKGGVYAIVSSQYNTFWHLYMDKSYIIIKMLLPAAKKVRTGYGHFRFCTYKYRAGLKGIVQRILRGNYRWLKRSDLLNWRTGSFFPIEF
jgi:hypothetical protein